MMMKTGKKRTAAVLAAGMILMGGLSGIDSISAAGLSSADQARQKALQKVPNATVTDVDLDRDNGQQVYDIELVKGSKKYDLTFRVSDGKLLEYGWEKVSVSPSRNRSLIGKEKCKQLVQKRVKNGKNLTISQKTDDGVDIYKVKVTSGNKRFTMEYHARTGALLECKWKLAQMQASSSNSGTRDIGIEKAKQIALEAVPGATVYKAEVDTDDGVPVYEIELVKGSYEYEFKIDASTGKILEQEKDRRD